MHDRARRQPQRPRRAAEALLLRPDDRLLPRRLLQHRPRGPRPPHRLRPRHRRVPRLLPRRAATTSRPRAPNSASPASAPATAGASAPLRWREAWEAGAAPKVVLASTHALHPAHHPARGAAGARHARPRRSTDRRRLSCMPLCSLCIAFPAHVVPPVGLSALRVQVSFRFRKSCSVLPGSGRKCSSVHREPLDPVQPEGAEILPSARTRPPAPRPARNRPATAAAPPARSPAPARRYRRTAP